MHLFMEVIYRGLHHLLQNNKGEAHVTAGKNLYNQFHLRRHVIHLKDERTNKMNEMSFVGLDKQSDLSLFILHVPATLHDLMHRRYHADGCIRGGETRYDIVGV